MMEKCLFFKVPRVMVQGSKGTRRKDKQLFPLPQAPIKCSSFCHLKHDYANQFLT